MTVYYTYKTLPLSATSEFLIFAYFYKLGTTFIYSFILTSYMHTQYKNVNKNQYELIKSVNWLADLHIRFHLEKKKRMVL